MAVFFWYPVKIDLSSVHVYNRVNWTSRYTIQGTRKKRPCLSGHSVLKASHAVNDLLTIRPVSSLTFPHPQKKCFWSITSFFYDIKRKAIVYHLIALQVDIIAPSWIPPGILNIKVKLAALAIILLSMDNKFIMTIMNFKLTLYRSFRKDEIYL